MSITTRKDRKKRPATESKQLFKLTSEFKPAGDQPEAIKKLLANFEAEKKHQVLLGVTGSGKTFTMAHTIAQLNLPTLIMAPNKTLAAQLYAEFKALFPENAVEYFVSYYDYYQPEAYIASTDTFIEKDSAINEQIDRMRHSATRSLLERKDVIIVASVSCIYGLGSPEAYQGMVLVLENNEELKRDVLLRELVRLQYNRHDIDFQRGSFRVRGDVVEIFPPSEDIRAIRVDFFGDFIDQISWIDPIRRTVIEKIDQIAIYPGSHYVNTADRFKKAIQTIQDELRERIVELKAGMKIYEAQRLEQRTYYDIEIMEELGFCPGIENYSRHFTGREPGAAPPTLIEYFPKEFLAIIDESHVTVPQVGGMYRGDRSRKTTLVEHGFRLPSALDNRPLNFQEFEKLMDKVVYVSATPGPYEIEKSGKEIVEQIIRPTGLIDPEIDVRPATHQVDNLLGEIKIRVAKKERVLVTTLTKKSAEDLTEYFEGLGIKVKYLHSDIDTLERVDILRDLRLGVFDVLIGINLLREGLDLPEVSLVAITDADKEGFLRSERSLIQTIGRAARNSEGKVIMYADHTTNSMMKAISETNRRRTIQSEYNKKHGITPQTIKKLVSEGLINIYQSKGKDIVREIPLALVSDQVREYRKDPLSIRRKIKTLRSQMKSASDRLEFEEAAKLRDEVKRLEVLELEVIPIALKTDEVN
ncbi:MAG: excinuclease ABC subunit UvrB [Bdellovibrionia bacterium]